MNYAKGDRDPIAFLHAVIVSVQPLLFSNFQNLKKKYLQILDHLVTLIKQRNAPG